MKHHKNKGDFKIFMNFNQIAMLQNDQGRHDLGDAGRIKLLILVFSVKDLTGCRV